MANVTLKINNVEVSAPEGSTILEAARLAHIEIPTLCFLKDINEIGACRMCVVEVKGARTLVTACVYPVNEGMEVFTNTPKVMESRKKTLQLLLSIHRQDCLACVRSGNCELQTLCKDYGVDNSARYEGAMPASEIDDSAAHMVRDNSKCILCRRCIAACEKTQGVGVIGATSLTFFCASFRMSSLRISGSSMLVIQTVGLVMDCSEYHTALAVVERASSMKSTPAKLFTCSSLWALPSKSERDSAMFF